jgi:hypothetical protein
VGEAVWHTEHLGLVGVDRSSCTATPSGRGARSSSSGSREGWGWIAGQRSLAVVLVLPFEAWQSTTNVSALGKAAAVYAADTGGASFQPSAPGSVVACGHAGSDSNASRGDMTFGRTVGIRAPRPSLASPPVVPVEGDEVVGDPVGEVVGDPATQTADAVTTTDHANRSLRRWEDMVAERRPSDRRKGIPLRLDRVRGREDLKVN